MKTFMLVFAMLSLMAMSCFAADLPDGTYAFKGTQTYESTMWSCSKDNKWVESSHTTTSQNRDIVYVVSHAPNGKALGGIDGFQDALTFKTDSSETLNAVGTFASSEVELDEGYQESSQVTLLNGHPTSVLSKRTQTFPDRQKNYCLNGSKFETFVITIVNQKSSTDY